MITKFKIFENIDLLSDEEIMRKLVDNSYSMDKNKYFDYIKQLKNINYYYRGTTPLLWTIYNNYIDIIKYLLKAGASVNLQDNNNKMTPIMAAFDDSYTEVIDLLSKNGADWNIRNKDGFNFIEYCNDVESRFDNWEDDEFKEKLEIINDKEYPKLMNNYLLNKNLENFNI